MKSNLYSLFLGSTAYNVFQLVTTDDKDGRYMYATGVILSILAIGGILDYLQSNKGEETNET